MGKDTLRRRYARRSAKEDRRPRNIFPRDPMKHLLKRMTNTKIRQGMTVANGAAYRRLVDLVDIFYD